MISLTPASIGPGMPWGQAPAIQNIHAGVPPALALPPVPPPPGLNAGFGTPSPGNLDVGAISPSYSSSPSSALNTGGGALSFQPEPATNTPFPTIQPGQVTAAPNAPNWTTFGLPPNSYGFSQAPRGPQQGSLASFFGYPGSYGPSSLFSAMGTPGGAYGAPMFGGNFGFQRQTPFPFMGAFGGFGGFQRPAFNAFPSMATSAQGGGVTGDGSTFLRR